MSKDPEEIAHLEWLGYVQPVGLVVSIPALLAAQAHVNRNIAPEHREFLSCLPKDRFDEIIPEIRDISEFSTRVLGWEPSDLIPFPHDGSIPENMACLEVVLPEYHETLRPTHIVPEFKPKNGQKPWLMLVQSLPSGTDLDQPRAEDHRNWQASPHAKFERLLRETEVPIGLLFNSTHLRLIYAPRGETSGYATFSVAEMAQVAGRPIFAAFHMLLSGDRLFSLPEAQRLPAILSESRKYQNTVSTQLAEQVLEALYELLRGFQAADDQQHVQLLGKVLADDPNHVYAGLLTVLMRLVFILYAEDRGLMPTDSVYTNHYAVTGLFERLREDAGRYPDTMDLRYGAWGQLLTLFRLIHIGGNHGELRIPAREGYLFDPDRYPFLEGRQRNSEELEDLRLDIPRVSDSVVFRVLSNLLILGGDRLSYRTLDVEQIGSVYEAIMGFYLETARGRSIAIKPAKPHGAPTTINLEGLLSVKGTDRAKWFKVQTDQSLTGQAADALADAETINDVLAALDRKIAKKVTPNVVPPGAMILQPSDERRRSGSHYTPRSLTEPIVRTTLKPILKRLGAQPTPEQILDLKVCDPAMGSGAFLVEVCRQLGDELVKAWHFHDAVPFVPPDEDELLHARRLIAQRCVYGVDKNPMAVDLAKLSLWLATLAKDHPFTFLDHCLRCGDSLVGLTREQISRFHWEPSQQLDAFAEELRKKIETATAYRRDLMENVEFTPYLLLQQKLGLADEALNYPNFIGDLITAAFFSADKDRERRQKRNELLDHAIKWMEKTDPESLLKMEDALNWLRIAGPPVRPFHWELEFPEVFDKENGGFAAIVGNPPFLSGRRISTAFGLSYFGLLKSQFPPAGNLCDLVAYFFRRSFEILRKGGTFGLLATNTVAQGDTREGGLAVILANGGQIFAAGRRHRWPGLAAVIVSVVHAAKAVREPSAFLDDKRVSRISAYLLPGNFDDSPHRLNQNPFFSGGSKIYGQGFLFADNDDKCTPVAVRERILALHPDWAARIPPYIGGEEINSHPQQLFHRYVICLSDVETEPALAKWPELLQIVSEKVKPDRDRLPDSTNNIPLKRRWWAYQAHRPDLYLRLAAMNQVLVNSQVGPHLVFVMLPTHWIFSQQVNVFCIDTFAGFGVLQSRVHELWARYFASSLKDDLRYTASDCFATFPLPLSLLIVDAENVRQSFSQPGSSESDGLHLLEECGSRYHDCRAGVMIRNQEGLTTTYHRFHDPDETSPEIKELRELHARMDRAVLDEYGWTDLRPTCEFLLDYEDQDEEDENGGSSRGRSRRKPWRYRWPDDFRDEVLARLLELNKERAEEERLVGITAEVATGKTKSKVKSTGSLQRKRKKKNPENQTSMFNLE